MLGIWKHGGAQALGRPDRPERFSLKDMTAKPTIWAQHPASAAPPASPVSPRAAQMAADEMGSVSAMPMTTDTMTPMKKGCSSVAHMMNPPTDEASAPIHGAAIRASPQPPRMVTAGVTMMSTFVSLGHGLAQLGATTATTSTAKGAARAACVVGGEAHSGQREQHERRGVQRVSDGDGHGRPRHAFGERADLVEERQARKIAHGAQDGADEKRSEQTLRHGRQRVDGVALESDLDILAL